MTTRSPSPPRAPLRGFLLGLLAALAGALALASCGGGVGTGGTGSYGEGPVSGFGSIFVGGIEFDDAQAAVQDEEGRALGAAALRLGMLTAVDGSAVGDGANGPSATALSVRLARLAVGPVDAIDAGTRSFSVLGQSVQVDGSTVFDRTLRGGLAGLHVGDVVSVHALADPAGHPVATRVEPAGAGEPWRVRGTVSALDAAAHRFAIGAATFDATGAAAPAGLADGSFVQLRLAGAASGGAYPVAAFVPVAAPPADAARVEVEGIVAAPTPPRGFRLGALAVDASAAAIDPAAAALAAGAHVQVEGRLQAGVLVASRVALLTPQQAGHRTYTVIGSVDSIDAAALTFVVRGVEVDYSAASFVGGTAASLAAGMSVQVQGPLSADGTQVRATQVKIR